MSFESPTYEDILATGSTIETNEKAPADEAEPKDEEFEVANVPEGLVVGKEKQVPDPKIIGETLTLNGETFVVESLETPTTYRVRSITPDKTQPDGRARSKTVDALGVSGQAKLRREEMWADLRDRFGFNQEEVHKLETDPEYQNLSYGQKKYVIEALTQSTLERVDEVAAEKFKAANAKKGFRGKVLDSMLEETRMNTLRKEAFAKMRGGLEEHEGSLKAIISRINSLGEEMIVNEEGKVEIQYAKNFGKTLLENGQSLVAQRRYNKAATALQSIPPEWESQTATKKQRDKAEQAKAEFEAARQACFNNIAFDPKSPQTPEFWEQSNLIDSKVNLNRLMNAEPENDRVLQELNKVSGNFYGTAKDVAYDLVGKERRGYYMLGGWFARGALNGASNVGQILGGLGTGLISGGIGAIRGYDKAKKLIRKDEQALRRGAEKDSKGQQSEMLRIGEWDDGKHKGYVDKINDIISKMESADRNGNAEGATFYKAMLDNRIKYAMDRAAKGKITFGDKNVRMGNQAAFASAINRATAYSLATDTAVQSNWLAEVNRLMKLRKVNEKIDQIDNQKVAEQKKFIRNYTIRNAALASAFGIAGYTARHVYEVLDKAGVIDRAIESVSGAVGSTLVAAKEAAKQVAATVLETVKDAGAVTHGAGQSINHPNVRLSTSVAMDTPGTVEIEGGHDISQFFDKSGEDSVDAVETSEIPTANDSEAVTAEEDVLVGEEDLASEDANRDTAETSVKEESIRESAYIKKGDGVEHTLKRQIAENPEIAKALGYKGDPNDAEALRKFSDSAAHKLAIAKGYVNPGTGEEIHVGYDREKSNYFQINIQPDGSVDVATNGENLYAVNTAASPDGQEYVYRNGQKVPVIHNSMTIPPHGIDKGEEYYEEFGNHHGASSAGDTWEESDPSVVAAAKSAENTQPSNSGSKEKTLAKKDQVGKKLKSEENAEPVKKWRKGYKPMETSRGPYQTSRGSYQTALGTYPTAGDHYPTNASRTIQSYRHEIDIKRQLNPETYDMPRSPRGSYYRLEKFDGEVKPIDTRSYDPDHAFYGRVNRQYNRLIEESFGTNDIVSRDKIVDHKIAAMLEKNAATNDLAKARAIFSRTPGGAMHEVPNRLDQDTRDYLEIIYMVHEKSGLAPRPYEPTDLYIKEAFQKMQNDGKNIRQFVTGLLEHQAEKSKG